MLEKNEKVVEIHPHSQLVFKRLLFLDEEAEKKEFEHMVARKLAYKQVFFHFHNSITTRH